MIEIINRIKENKLFGFFFGIAMVMWLSFIFLSHNPYVDENIHTRQIGRFMKENYEILPSLTTIPGYHVVMALIMQVFNHPSLTDMRLVSLFLSLISLWIFFLTAKVLNTKDSIVKTLQFMFLPVSFFFFPLIYTDIFALLLVLSAFYFSCKKHYNLSALFSLFAILVRQNNIVWILFIWVYAYISENGFSISFKKVVQHMRHTSSQIFLFIAFAIFFLINHGIAIGDREDHPLGFYMGNIYFFLALVGFLFVPVLINLTYKFNWFRNNKKLLIFGVAISIILSVAFIIFPPILHKGNLVMHFLRNIILSYAYGQYAFIYALAIFLGCITLTLSKFKKESLIIFPFIVACLAPSLLIEQRYAIVPFVFVLLLREQEDKWTEFLLVIYFMLIPILLMWMILKTPIFL